MKKYTINKAMLETNETSDIKKGCTINDPTPETICECPSIAEASVELLKYHSTVKKIQCFTNVYFLVEEYCLEVTDDEELEDIIYSDFAFPTINILFGSKIVNAEDRYDGLYVIDDASGFFVCIGTTTDFEQVDDADAKLFSRYDFLINAEFGNDTERYLGAIQRGEITETSLVGSNINIAWYLSDDTGEEWAYSEDGNKLSETEIDKLR